MRHASDLVVVLLLRVSEFLLVDRFSVVSMIQEQATTKRCCCGWLRVAGGWACSCIAAVAVLLPSCLLAHRCP